MGDTNVALLCEIRVLLDAFIAKVDRKLGALDRAITRLERAFGPPPERAARPRHLRLVRSSRKGRA